MIDFDKDRIIKYMIDRKMGNYTFSKKCGISHDTLVKILYYNYNCRYITIRKFARVMNLRPIDLIKNKKEKL